MIKVTLLGDSIRMIGYGLEVPALLGEDFEVFQPDDNCRFAKYTLRGKMLPKTLVGKVAYRVLEEEEAAKQNN